MTHRLIWSPFRYNIIQNLSFTVTSDPLTTQKLRWPPNLKMECVPTHKHKHPTKSVNTTETAYIFSNGPKHIKILILDNISLYIGCIFIT